jgi:hypothetical protein
MNANSNPIPPITIPDTFKPFKRNHWVVYEEPKFCQYFCLWYAEFPPGEMLNLWEQWAFAKELLRAGQEEGIYRIIRSKSGYSETPHQSYNDWVEEILRNQGKLVALDDLEYSLAPTRLSHYDLQGNIVETEIPIQGYYFSNLLSDLRPDIDHEENRLYLSSSYPPIHLKGSRARIWEREEFPDCTDEEYESLKFGTMYLVISTSTDIWFPKLMGYLEDVDRCVRDQYGNPLRDENGLRAMWKPEWKDMSGWFDNRELAQLNTPRFNNFIQRVKQLVLTYGGTWKIDKEACMEGYRPQWNEDGIVLDC